MGEGAGVGVREEIKPVSLAQNIAFNSKAAPNYKHIISPHRGLRHLKNITVKYIES